MTEQTQAPKEVFVVLSDDCSLVTTAASAEVGDDEVAQMDADPFVDSQAKPHRVVRYTLSTEVDARIAAAVAEERERLIAAFTEGWDKPRFGAFDPDGSFREYGDDYPQWEKDPQAHTARWVGGKSDMQLVRAAAIRARKEQSNGD